MLQVHFNQVIACLMFTYRRSETRWKLDSYKFALECMECQ